MLVDVPATFVATENAMRAPSLLAAKRRSNDALFATVFKPFAAVHTAKVPTPTLLIPVHTPTAPPETAASSVCANVAAIVTGAPPVSLTAFSDAVAPDASTYTA